MSINGTMFWTIDPSIISLDVLSLFLSSARYIILLSINGTLFWTIDLSVMCLNVLSLFLSAGRYVILLDVFKIKALYPNDCLLFVRD